ncbi:MAG: hypothetical protein WA121_02660 [Syntrophales bacterium]
MRFSYVTIIMIALFVLSGCATFKVEDLSGIKSILDNKIEAEYWASKVKTGYTGSDKDKIMPLYEEAYLANNKWIAGIQLDIQSKDTLKVSQDDYSNHLAGLTSTQFISSAKRTLTSDEKKGLPEKGLSIEIPVGIPIGDEAAKFVTRVINNIVELQNKKVGEARKRIYEELEKAKWREWRELK